MIRINLQLFASKSNGSTSTSFSESHSSEEGGSSYSKSGGSHSETNTQGQSITNAQSHSETHTEGNSSSISAGKTWASGKIDDNTQAQFDKYNKDYVQSDKVTDAYNALQETLSQKPTFESTYADKLSELYDSIMNRDKFNYNFNEDAMYQMYKDQYTQAGKQAMEDTLGRAQAANGGYGSSYSQSAGQQTYQQYLKDLNNIIPTLRNQAYEEYQNEGNELLNKYNITNQAYNNEYGQYRDSVADWQADRSYNYGMYSDERNFDWNQYQSNRNYWNQEYWNEKNAEQSNYQASNTWYQEDSATDTQSHSQTDYWEHSTTDTSYWENGSTNTWNNSSGYTGSIAQTMYNAQQAAGYTGGTVSTAGKNAGSSNWQELTFDQQARTVDEMLSRYGQNAYDGGGVDLNDKSNKLLKKYAEDAADDPYSRLSDPEIAYKIQNKLDSIQDAKEAEEYLDGLVNSDYISEKDYKYLLEMLLKKRNTTDLNGVY